MSTLSLKLNYSSPRHCRGITRIHRSPSRPRPAVRPTAAFINIHEHLIQDIQEEPRRRIGPSRVKELAKFFTPTSDEEENSRVNNRTRRKKLFEPKREEESEK